MPRAFNTQRSTLNAQHSTLNIQNTTTMNNYLKTTMILVLACLLIPSQVSAQKRKGQKRRTATTTLKTYPSRDDAFVPDYRLQPIGECDIHHYDYDYTILPEPDFTGHVLRRDMTRPQVTLRQVSCRQNDITDYDAWLNNNGLTPSEVRYWNEPMDEMRPRYRYDTDGYSVVSFGVHYGATETLIIADPSLQTLYKAYDFREFRFSPKTPKAYANQIVDFVQIEGNILYVCHTSNSYPSEAGYQTGYISAIDMRTDEILWTTEPMTCNSDFAIVGNSIVCGYGFSDNPDHLYVVDKYSGQRLQKIPLKKMATMILSKADRVYVRTYSYGV